MGEPNAILDGLVAVARHTTRQRQLAEGTAPGTTKLADHARTGKGNGAGRPPPKGKGKVMYLLADTRAETPVKSKSLKRLLKQKGRK